MIAVVQERCAGLDVHRDTVMGCVMWGGAHEEAQWELRKFGTTVGDLLQLKAWLREQGCRQVVVESTGVYWEPVFNVLGEEWEEQKRLERVGQQRELAVAEAEQAQALAQTATAVTLANPQEVKNRRGHKTDKKDAWWLAHLFRHGMIRPSYVPERAIRELRLLTRQRREKIRDVAQEKNRLQKVLEQGNVKLRGVMSDLFGASGEAMLRAMIQGHETDPVKLADLAKGSLKKKREELIAALTGHRLSDAHRLLLRQGMEHMALLVQQIEELDRQVEEKIRAEGWQRPYQNLQSVPGIKETGAGEVIAEVGPKPTTFPSAGHLSSWGGICPGNHESAGKRRSGRTQKGNPYFRAMLNQSAWASARQKGSEFQARYQKLSPKLKHKGAIIGVAHALVYAIYNVLTYERPYQPPRVEGLDQQQTRRLIRHHSKRLKKLQAWLPKAPLLSDCTKVLRKLDALEG
jgi:transposase